MRVPDDPSTPYPDPERPSSPAGRFWVLPVTILGSSLGFIDGSVVNVALPTVQADLRSTLSMMQWVVNGYMLMLASLLLLGGSLGDRWGRRRVFIGGLVLFAVASVACGLAPSAGWLIAARVLQGAGAALLMPNSLAIIGTAYPEEERGRAIGTWAASAAIMTAIGPPLGGWLVDLVGWRAIFYINPPIAAVALVLAARLPDDPGVRGSGRPDIAGSALAVLALGLFSYGLIALGEGRDAVGWIALLAAVPAGAVFVFVEARASAPMLPLGLFGNRSFSGANLLTVILYAALSGSLFLIPFLLIKVHGYSATAAGAAFLPFSIIMGAGSRLAGDLSDRLGARLPLIVGPGLTGLGFLLLAVTASQHSYWASTFPGLVLVGVGMTVAIPPLTAVVFASVPAASGGVASAINNAAARGGGLIAVAAIGLAFAGQDLSTLRPEELERAYAVAMYAAAGLAFASAICAALTIPAHLRRGVLKG